MAGEAVYNSDSDKVGQVADVVYDQNGEPIAVIVEVGPFLSTGDKNVAIPPNDATTSNGRATINRTKAQLNAAPDSPLPDYSSSNQKCRVRCLDAVYTSRAEPAILLQLPGAAEAATIYTRRAGPNGARTIRFRRLLEAGNS
jgi:hypothetical protein